MRYSFNIDETKIENNKYKIYEIYGFLHKGFLFELKTSAIISAAVIVICSINPYLGFNNINLFIRFILTSILFYCLIFHLGHQIFTIDNVYKQTVKALSEPVLIKDINIFNDIKNDNMENTEIVPGITIKYDCNRISKDKTAVMLKLDDNLYKIVNFIDSSKIENNIELTIPADKVLEAIRQCNDECVSEQNVMMVVICKLESDMDIYDSATDNDINNSIMITELIYVPNFMRESDTSL